MSKYVYLHYQIFYFTIIGFTATCIHYLSLYLLVESFTLPALAANVIAYIFAFQFSYIALHYPTFNHGQPHPNKSYARFLVTNLAGLSLNETLFYFFLVQFALTYTMAFVATSLVLIPMTFSTYKFWSFAEN